MVLSLSFRWPSYRMLQQEDKAEPTRIPRELQLSVTILLLILSVALAAAVEFSMRFYHQSAGSLDPVRRMRRHHEFSMAQGSYERNRCPSCQTF
jgi:hypothetical protein